MRIHPFLGGRTRSWLRCALLFGCALLAAGAQAKISTWTDAAGNSFKAEPVEVLGPFALFKTGAAQGHRVLLRGLPEAECRRFAAETAAHAPRAARWSDARGAVTAELRGRVKRVAGPDKLEPVDLGSRPEPELMVLLFASHNEGPSWQMLGNFEPTYRRLQAVYPGRMEAVLIGLRHDATQHLRIATAGNHSWLVADFSQQRSLGTIMRLAPREGRSLVAVSREGVPLFSSAAETLGDIRKFVDQLTEFLRLTDPANPANWPDRLHYLAVTRPLALGTAGDGPLLVGDPLRDDGLRQRGVARVVATIDVDAEGRATRATIDPSSGVPEPMIAPLAQALMRSARFAPAIAGGRPVAGTYAYDRAVAAAPRVSAAELAWITGQAQLELPLEHWLVLKPVAVPEQVFSQVEGVDESGVVTLSAYDASSAKVSRTAQLTAFHSDWFGPAGPGDFRPKAGDTQEIDGQPLTWTALQADADGYVDLQVFNRRDYCIGYAFTEVQLPQALDGWLGIGSDDGLRIWLNGELVHDRWVRRPSKVDEDIVPLKLKAGSNRILIKIQNITLEWSFIPRLWLRGR